jgi:hypothetical protein
MVKQAVVAMVLLLSMGLARGAGAAELVMSKYRVRCPAALVASTPGGKTMAFELGSRSVVLPVLMSGPADFREQEFTPVQLGPDPLVTGWVRTEDLPTVVVREVFLAHTAQAGESEVGVRLAAGTAVVVLKRSDGSARVRYPTPGFKAEGWVPEDALGTFFETVPTVKENLRFLSYMPQSATFLDAPRGKPIVTVRGVPGSLIMMTGRIEKGYALAVWTDGAATVRGWFPQAKAVTEQDGLYGNVIMTAGDRERLVIDVPGGTPVLDDINGNVLGQFVVGTRNNILLEQRDGASRVYVWTRLGRFAAWVPIAPEPHPGPWAAKH